MIAPFDGAEKREEESEQEEDQIKELPPPKLSEKKYSIRIDAHGSLSEFDKDGDGEITRSELEKYVEEHLGTVRDKVMLKRTLVAISLLLLVFSVVVAGMTMGIVEYNKETVLDGDGSMRSKSDDELVVTGSPTYYTTISDIPSLPPTALEAINRVTFVTVDGRSHIYLVDGVESRTDGVTVFFPRFKELHFEGDSILFRNVDSGGHVVSEVGVVVPDDSSSRRLALIEEEFSDNSHTEPDSLINRCSGSSEMLVCYHTYGEIQHLGRMSPRQGARHLTSYTGADSTPSFAEVNADIRVLMRDSRSNMEEATSFIENILGSSNFGKSSDTISISFTMRERCVNYPTLAQDCLSTPVPSDKMGRENLGVEDLLRPFPGLVSSMSRWYFQDEVEYTKDEYSICLKIRYGHDPLHGQRRHVVLMDRDDPTRIVTYDEVSSLTDPQTNLDLAESTIFVTNYKETSTLDEDEGGPLLRGRRSLRRLRADDLFHEHVRNHKVAGFPRLRLPATPDESSSGAAAGRRSLQEEDEDEDDIYADESAYGNVTETETDEVFEVEMSTDNCLLHFSVSNLTEAVESGAIDDATVYENDFGGAIEFLPAELDEETVLPDMAEPLALFSGVDIHSSHELIQWPSAADSVSLHEFNDVVVVQRALLKVEQESHVDGGDEDNTRFRRHLYQEGEEEMASSSQEGMKGGDEKLDRINDEFQQLDNAFTDLLQHIEKMQNQRVEDEQQPADQKLEELDGRQLQHDSSGDVVAQLSFYELLESFELVSSDAAFDRPAWRVDEELFTFADATTYDIVLKTSLVKYVSGEYSGWYYSYGDLDYTDDCSLFRYKTLAFNRRYEEIIRDSSETLHESLSYVTTKYSSFYVLGKALQSLENLEQSLDYKIFNDLIKIPHIGFKVNQFRNKFMNMMEKFDVADVRKAVNSLYSKLKTKVKKLEYILEVNARAVMAMVKMQKELLNVAEPLLAMDAACPDVVGAFTAKSCKDLAKDMTPNNMLLTEFDGAMTDFNNYVDNELLPLTMSSKFFVDSDVWSTASEVVKETQEGVTLAKNFLKEVFTSCIPQYEDQVKKKLVKVKYVYKTKYCYFNWGGKKFKYPCRYYYRYRYKLVKYTVSVKVDKCWSYDVASITSLNMNCPYDAKNALFASVYTAAKHLGFPQLQEVVTPAIPALETVKSVLGDMDVSLAKFTVPSGMVSNLYTKKREIEDVAKNLPTCAAR